MLIENYNVYGFDEAIIASGFPMMKENINIKRAENLGNCSPGSGHDCYLKGIIVQADITAPQYWWLQWQRYHFCDIISSQSKMHKITKMDIDKQCSALVNTKAKENLEETIEAYNNNEIVFDVVLANVPMGLELKARITTNYLQLKTQYFQRHNHRSRQWTTYCNWILNLPMFKELCLKEGDNYEK